jgi:hypothetical protein
MRRRCRKRRYRDKQEALGVARWRMGSNVPNAPWYLRAYECHLCRGWHLTSQKPCRERLV